eukprot:5934782-Pyramimonas_sp.AAC.1
MRVHVAGLVLRGRRVPGASGLGRSLLSCAALVACPSRLVVVRALFPLVLSSSTLASRCLGSRPARRPGCI